MPTDRVLTTRAHAARTAGRETKLLLLVALVLPAGFVAGAMFARGWLQAFCAGALIPAFIAPYMLLLLGALSSGARLIAAGTPGAPKWQHFAESLCQSDTRFILATFWIAMLITGAICVLFRWLLDDNERSTA